MKTINLILFLLCCSSISSLAVNTPNVKSDRKEIARKDNLKHPLSLKQEASLFLLKKWAKQKNKKRDNSKNKKTNGPAIASFFGSILSGIGLIVAFSLGNILWLIVAGLIASFTLYLGIKGLKKAKNEPKIYGGKALSIIGIVLGSVSVLITYVILAFGLFILGVLFVFSR